MITGSTSGIGEAIARRFHAAGAFVVINSRSSVEAGERIADELNGRYVKGDIATDAQQICDEAAGVRGVLDHLINNAGFTKVIPHEDLEAVSDDLWERIIDVNVNGTWKMCRAAAPLLAKGDGGSIINISSIAGLRPLGSSIPYSVSKAAVNQLTVLLAKALGPAIRVNAIAPGLIETPWTQGWDELRAQVENTAPARRVGTPQDVADACLSLATSSYITGEILTVDGGLTLTT